MTVFILFGGHCIVVCTVHTHSHACVGGMIDAGTSELKRCGLLEREGERGGASRSEGKKRWMVVATVELYSYCR